MTSFQTSNWENIETTRNKGAAGFAMIKTTWLDNIQIRIIEYSAGYKADHWCSKGHIVQCLEGEYEILLKDGSKHKFSKGMSYQTLDDEANPHMAVSKTGCKLFVVDGDFLKLK